MAVKSLEDLNREFMLECILRYQSEPDKPLKLKEKKQSKVTDASPKKPKFVLISDILFYLAILVILISALPSSNGGAPRPIMGYSYFTVLTSSMQGEIPKGSFILVRQTDPQKLKTGDNITYMLNWNTSVTHKIVSIYENYKNSGARGFQTKGINNASPDDEIVYEKNVVGKVALVLPVVGAVISFLGANIYIVFIFFGLCVIFSFVFRFVFHT